MRFTAVVALAACVPSFATVGAADPPPGLTLAEADSIHKRLRPMCVTTNSIVLYRGNLGTPLRGAGIFVDKQNTSGVWAFQLEDKDNPNQVKTLFAFAISRTKSTRTAV